MSESKNFEPNPVDLAVDAMIAATARVHGMVVATRNVKDFASFGVKVFNPISSK